LAVNESIEEGKKKDKGKDKWKKGEVRGRSKWWGKEDSIR